MSIVPVCGLSNVYAASNAVPLMQEFCACPAALDMLKQVNVPVGIQMSADLIHGAMMIPSHTKDHRLSGAAIGISSKFNDKAAVFRLAFEVSNAIQESQQLPFRQAVANGDVSMDDYARNIEVSEINSTRNTLALQLKCSKFPGFEISGLAKELNALSEEEHLWHQDFRCHTDAYRLQWITQDQETYCRKHPEDIKSCKATVSDLCDMDALNHLPKIKFDELINKRICERYFTAPAYWQDLYRYRVEESCPEILPSSGRYSTVFLGSVATLVAVAAAKCFIR
jgi:hypothetical protein